MNMNYARAFRVIRGVKGLNKAELAKLLGVHESYISLIESGKRKPGRRLIERVAPRVGVPTHVFDLLAADKEELQHIGPESAQAIGELLIGILPA